MGAAIEGENGDSGPIPTMEAGFSFVARSSEGGRRPYRYDSTSSRSCAITATTAYDSTVMSGTQP